MGDPAPRLQFSIRTLFWLTLVVAAFLGGWAFQGRKWALRNAEWLARELASIAAAHE